jgi:DNA (cytosine-5)-methyltransferase 1
VRDVPDLDAVMAEWKQQDRRAVDLFAGPGGWSLAAESLGIAELGVEWDDSACATRAAAGLRTLQADVGKLDPAAFGPVTGLIGSPPCPTFSRAGTGSGKHLTDVIVGCMRALLRGEDTRQQARDEAYVILLPLAKDAEGAKAAKQNRAPDWSKAEAKARRDADMSVLVVEPLRWALELEPTWITLEQVPDVLGLWQVVAELLREVGYSCWTGILEAERYGVAQTRERAVLIARRDGKAAQPPVPTHQRYVPGEPRLEHPQLTLEGEVQPWVSMADAIAYGMTCRPGFTVRAGKSPLEVMDGGAAAREAILEASGEWRQRSNYNDGATDDRTRRDLGEPSTSITGKPPQWEHVEAVELVGGALENQARRSVDEPAPTIVGGHDTSNRRWEGTRTAEGGALLWPEERPATTLMGDHRVMGPGRHDPNESGSQQKFAVRVTVAEAGVLQSFPADYPWQGALGKQYQQVGNAVPPLLALRVLEAATDAVPLA